MSVSQAVEIEFQLLGFAVEMGGIKHAILHGGVDREILPV